MEEKGTEPSSKPMPLDYRGPSDSLSPSTKALLRAQVQTNFIEAAIITGVGIVVLYIAGVLAYHADRAASFPVKVAVWGLLAIIACCVLYWEFNRFSAGMSRLRRLKDR